MKPQVSVGPSSILGWATFAFGEVYATLVKITGSQAELHGPAKWTAIGGLVSLIATGAMRQLQEVHLIKAGAVAGEVAQVAPALAALATEVQANVAKVGTDGTDGPHVEFSGATPPAA